MLGVRVVGGVWLLVRERCCGSPPPDAHRHTHTHISPPPILCSRADAERLDRVEVLREAKVDELEAPRRALDHAVLGLLFVVRFVLYVVSVQFVVVSVQLCAASG